MGLAKHVLAVGHAAPVRMLVVPLLCGVQPGVPHASGTCALVVRPLGFPSRS